LTELWEWTDDEQLVRELAPALEEGLAWIETARERHGDDPFLYYDRSPDVGLRHKAWRDTPGSVQFPDGEPTDTPIASVEVQGYVYRALADGARIYDEVLSDPVRANELRADVESLANAFEDEFWLDEVSFYAAAKAGDGTLVPTLTSNVEHCLWTGIVSSDRVDAVAETLLSDQLFSGWGLRTMATRTTGYSPTSYHLGSVWPHDTSLAALGLAAYGQHDDAETLSQALLEASTHFDNNRIPELFCGFDDDVRPKTYPMSCVPQAWSAAAPYALLRAGFGLAPVPEPSVHNQPDFLDQGAVDPLLTM